MIVMGWLIVFLIDIKRVGFFLFSFFRSHYRVSVDSPIAPYSGCLNAVVAVAGREICGTHQP